MLVSDLSKSREESQHRRDHRRHFSYPFDQSFGKEYRHCFWIGPEVYNRNQFEES